MRHVWLLRKLIWNHCQSLYTIKVDKQTANTHIHTHKICHFSIIAKLWVMIFWPDHEAFIILFIFSLHSVFIICWLEIFNWVVSILKSHICANFPVSKLWPLSGLYHWHALHNTLTKAYSLFVCVCVCVCVCVRVLAWC